MLLALAGCSTVRPRQRLAYGVPAAGVALNRFAVARHQRCRRASPARGRPARLRSGTACPDGPERLAALPGLLDLAAHYDAEIDTRPPLLLAALLNCRRWTPTASAHCSRPRHALYPQEAAPLIRPLPPTAETKPFAIAAYTLLAAGMPGVEAGLLSA